MAAPLLPARSVAEKTVIGDLAGIAYEGGLSGGTSMRLIALPLVFAVCVALSGCAVVEVGSAVVGAGATVVGTAVDVTGDVVSTAADTVTSSSDKKKPDDQSN
jgi:hypothetical protein